jgi:uncharacterized protein
MSDLLTTGNLARLLMGSSAVLWVVIVSRLARRVPVVPLVPREPAPWHPFAVAFAMPVTILVQLVVQSANLPTEPPTVAYVRSACLAMMLQSFVLMGLLAVWTEIRGVDFGLNPPRLRDDLRYGALGFLASWMPVVLVNVAIEELGWRSPGAEHSFLKILKDDLGNEVLVWIVLAVVVCAPLAEELLYRVVIQGWLESRLSPRSAILFVGVLFAAVHSNDKDGRPDAIPLFPLALILGYVYYTRRSYLTVVLLHALFNAINLAFAIATRPA